MFVSRSLLRFSLLAVLAALFCASSAALTLSTTTLAASTNPVRYGQALTLTATVTAGATGKVTFYDGVAILGILSLSGPTASITTLMLPSGTRNLRAYYAGDATYGPSTSADLLQTVTPGPSLGLKSAVDYPTGLGTRSVAVADFDGDLKLDLATANSNSGSVSILLGNGDGTFRAAVNYAAGSGPFFVVTGDWNGDGKPDLAVANSFGNSISILLGNGNGTFQNAISITLPAGAQYLAVGDFNQDGKADLAVASSGGSSILLGNGDGTFQAPAALGFGARNVAVGDINHDGKTDLVFSLDYNTIAVLPGKGDGTFGPSTTFTAGSYSLALADINGDGNLDIVVGDLYYYGGTCAYFLGNGDGTFQGRVFFGANTYALGLTPVDINGDGVLDAVLVSNTFSSVAVLLGNGNGSFQGYVGFPLSSSASAMATGDFNGDGKVDVAVVPLNSNHVSILLGGAVPDLSITLSHGNGFTQGQVGASYKVTVGNIGDVGSSGAVGVVVTMPAGNLTLTSISGSGWTCFPGTATCTRSDTLPPGGSYSPIYALVNVSSATGSVTTTASVSGGGDGNSANNLATDTTNVRLSTSLSLLSTPNPSVFGKSITLDASVSNGSGKVTFYDGARMLGVGTVFAGHATLTTSLLASGQHSLTARYDGDTTYGPSLTPAVLQTVNAVSATGALPSRTITVGSTPLEVIVADLNGDGRSDIITANALDVSVLLGNGDGTFQTAVSYAPQPNNGYSSFTSVAVGDVNGDGKPDLVVVSRSNSVSVSVLIGNGDGTFQSPVVLPAISTGLISRGVSIADVTRDGAADIVILGDSGVTVLPGNGNGTFQAAVVTTIPFGIQSGFASLVDMNQDGILDLVTTTSAYGPTVNVYLSMGDGSFQAPITHSGISTYAMALTAGDFTGDGKADVAIIYWVGVGLLTGNGDGTVQNPLLSPLSAVPGSVVVAGDFNGDGKLDFAYGGYSQGTVTLAFGNGDGTFQVGTSLRTDGYGGGIAVGDFNGDGKPDFVVTTPNLSTINVFLGAQFSGLGVTSNHIGRFTAGSTGSYQILITNPNYAVTTQTVSVVDTLPAGFTATSISGTGWICDISTVSCSRNESLTTGASFPPITVTVAIAANLPASTVNNQVSVSNAGIVNSATDPTGTVLSSTTSLTASPLPAQLGQPVTLLATVTGGISGAVTFLDGAAYAGSAVLSAGHATVVTRMLGSGTHALTAVYSGDATHGASRSTAQTVLIVAGASSGLTAGLQPATGSGPQMVVTGDFNGDGNLDLVTPNSTANTVSVLLGNGNGTFRAKVDYAAGTQPMAVVVGDFNGDGIQDLAVANQVSHTLSILLGNGDGTFQPASSIDTIQNPTRIWNGDFNQDGNLDLVVLFAGGDAQIYFGNGDATFRQGSSLGFGSTVAITPGDFNGDGKTDLALHAYSGIALLSGIGDGTFSSVYPYANGSYNPRATAAGDLNHDGFLDLVTTDSSAVNVFLGNGDGTFRPYVTYAVGSTPAAVAIGDVNGDGIPDILAANSGGNTISILLGKGDGTFLPQSSYSAGSSPLGVAVGDFNGDGRLDVAVANFQSNNLTVLLGVLTSVLQITSTHTGNFLFGQPASYTIKVINDGPGATTGVVSVVDTLPAGLTATAISGAGWSCTLATLTCTRADSLAAGASFPNLFVSVNVAPNAPPQVTNSVSVSAAGSVAASGTDPTTVTSAAMPPPVLSSPVDGQTGVSVNAALTWSASAGATGYDIQLGVTSPPINLATVAGLTFSSTLQPGTTYYWQVTARNSAGGSASTIWSFTTAGSKAPNPGNVSPTAGSGLTQQMTFTFNDPRGWQDLGVMNILVSNALDGRQACFLAYSRTINVLYLVNDPGDALLPGLVMNGTGTVGNSQCTINGATSSVTGSGNVLTIVLGVSFAPGFAGNKITYLAARDIAENNSGWQALGVWQVPGQAQTTTTAVADLTPKRGSGLTQAFTFTFTDSAGWQNLGVVNMLVNDALDGRHGCYLAYARSINVLYLVDDPGLNLLPGLTMNGAGSVENSQCSVDGVNSSVSGNGNSLIVTLKLTFKGSFSGNRLIFGAARDVTDANNTGWRPIGSWTIQ